MAARRGEWAGWDLGKRAHKFGATPTVHDGIKYASKKEAARAGELDMLTRAGEVAFYLRQVRFPIRPSRRDANDKAVDRGEVWVCDFLVWWTNGACTIEDTKGHRTRDYLRKKRLVEALYPFTIDEL